jgi:serine/threonine protein phosphatase PrpC
MQPVLLPRLELACVTDPGQIRSQNEDSIAADAEIGFAVLADGMGGHNAGEVASRIATDTISARITSDASAGRLNASRVEALIADYVDAANHAVLETANARPECRGMGTTLVLVLWHEGRVTYAHVGDSRLYLLRDGRLERLTRDHSLVQEQLDSGALRPDEARFALNRNVLTRAIGIDLYVDPDIHTRSVGPRDVYLLCSDGLTDMMTDEEIARTLLSSRDVTAAATRLVEIANEAGGHDNISLILAQVVLEHGRALS